MTVKAPGPRPLSPPRHQLSDELCGGSSVLGYTTPALQPAPPGSVDWGLPSTALLPSDPHQAIPAHRAENESTDLGDLGVEIGTSWSPISADRRSGKELQQLLKERMVSLANHASAKANRSSTPSTPQLSTPPPRRTDGKEDSSSSGGANSGSQRKVTDLAEEIEQRRATNLAEEIERAGHMHFGPLTNGVAEKRDQGGTAGKQTSDSPLSAWGKPPWLIDDDNDDVFE